MRSTARIHSRPGPAVCRRISPMTPRSASTPASPRPRGVPSYFPYDSSLRFDARVDPVEAAMLEIRGGAGSVTRFRRFAVAQFGEHALELYWLDGYGGGVFLPFRDATSGRETYGA